MRLASLLLIGLPLAGPACAQAALPAAAPTPPAAVAVAPYATAVEIPSRELAARKGAYYVFTTGSAGNFQQGGLPVSNGQFLNARLCNVSATQTAYITKRLFDTSATVAVPYGGVASPAALTAANTSQYSGTATNGSNIVVGGAASTVLQLSFGVGTSVVNNSTSNAQPTGVGFAYPGTKNELDELRILPPGTCFGQYVNGLPTTLTTQSVYLGMRFYAYVE